MISGAIGKYSCGGIAKPLYCMKKNSLSSGIHVLLAMAAGGFFPLKSAALVESTEEALLLHLSGAVRYDSNIFANAGEEGDVLSLFTPELQYIRQRGLLNLDARAGVELMAFSEYSEQNAQDFFASASFSYPNMLDYTPLFGTADVNWRQRSAAHAVLGRRIRSDVFDTSLRARYELSQKLAIRGLGAYNNEIIHQEELSSIHSWSTGAETVWVYSEKLEAFSGYRYRHTRTGGRREGPGLRATDHLVTAGAEGQFLPKISGRASLGAQSRRLDNESPAVIRPYALASLHWTPRERARVRLSGEADFDVTPDDRSVTRSAVDLAYNQQVYRGVSIEPAVSYRRLHFVDPEAGSRVDDVYGAAFSLLYDFAGGASMALRYSYETRHSDRSSFTYDRHLAELAARISF